MIIIKEKFIQKIIKSLMKLSLIKDNFIVLTWGEYFIIRQTIPFENLLKIEISEKNILALKLKYHSSSQLIDEYLVEIFNHDFENHKLKFNIWSKYDKNEFIKQSELNLTNQTNLTIKDLLENKPFSNKYGNNYRYFITLQMKTEILKTNQNDSQFSEVTLKYSLMNEIKNTEMRFKVKFKITKKEATQLCSVISFWNLKKYQNLQGVN